MRLPVRRRSLQRLIFCVSTIVGSLAFDADLRATESGSITFNQQIRPILADKCFNCHGRDANKRKADLRLDLADGAFAVNKDGRAAIKPGDLGQSEMWRRLTTTDADDIMPPPESHKALSPEERALIQKWIEQGAPYQKHWAFEPPAQSPLPEATTAPAAGRSPIDSFIQKRLGKEGLPPSPEADKATLIRRVTLALTGLPPTIDEVDAFQADTAPDAFEKVVDRLLASPHYGEQMARLWLDVARYGDTHGLHLDNERSMWAYRDWVVGAFNRNLPFDQFTVEQLAGDLLPNATLDQLTATGFSRCNVTTGEGGSIDAEYLFRYAVDRTATMMQTWMGLTGQCAVCHDHKFDPISAKEFYSLYSFFYSAADPAMDGNALLTAPTVQLRKPAHDEQFTALDAKAAEVEKRMAETLKSVVYDDPALRQPPPTVQKTETVWVEDEPPAGATFKPSPGQATLWVTVADGGKVFSGQRALKRTDPGLAQDYYEGGAPPLPVPPAATLFAHVFIDPADLPKSIMLQFHKGGWLHRAVWGDAEVIPWGTPNTTERVAMGPLPKAGEWVRLDIPAEKIGLKAGDQIGGLAFTQFGGTVYWDKTGVVGTVDPASDPAHSFVAWVRQNTVTPGGDLPGEVQAVFKKAEKDRTPEDGLRLRDYYVTFRCADTSAPFAPLMAEKAAIKKQRDDLNASLPATFVMRDLPEPRQANVMMRGQYDKPGDPVTRAVPAVFPALKPDPSHAVPNRLDLARWLVAPEHPLTARVAVNRFWQQFFGTGLVKTSGDFGAQGEPPSHPELLDWLAVAFRESGWDVKKLVKALVTSATWRQGSRITPDLWQRDPENRLLARGPRLRLDAEEIRDQALRVAGLLNPILGGKGVRPYQPPNIWEPVGFTGSNTANYTQDHGDALYRRSLYVFFKRTAPPPFLVNFDAPSREEFCTRRERSNTPLQALQLMNDVQHFEAARAFAERLMSAGATPPERIALGYRTVVARPPTPEEAAIVEATLASHLARYQAAPEQAKKLIANGESKPRAGLNEPELAAWTMVANLLLNLDETLTKN